MKIQENRSLASRRKIKIDDAELSRMLDANPVADLTTENVFAIEATIIDSEVTRNGTEYPADWQRAMREAWIGTRLHYSPSDHAPNAPDHVGWIYSAEIEESGSDHSPTGIVTSTVARFAIPIVADTERLVERLRAGLNHAVSIAVETAAENVKETADGIRHLSGMATPIHVALVGDPSSRKAGIRATSESVIISEAITPETSMLLNEAMKVRQPVIEEAVKYARLNARLNDQKQRAEELAERMTKWSLDEITMYRDTQRAAFKTAQPDASKQLANGDDSDAPSMPADWKPLHEVINANRGQVKCQKS